VAGLAWTAEDDIRAGGVLCILLYQNKANGGVKQLLFIKTKQIGIAAIEVRVCALYRFLHVLVVCPQ
jgi:hypothetical protein